MRKVRKGDVVELRSCEDEGLPRELGLVLSDSLNGCFMVRVATGDAHPDGLVEASDEDVAELVAHGARQ